MDQGGLAAAAERGLYPREWLAKNGDTAAAFGERK